MQTASPQAFVGTWKLLSMVATTASSKKKEAYGASPLGFITYTADGYMHAILMDANRPPVKTAPEDFGRQEGLSRVAFVFRHIPALIRSTSAMQKSAAYTGQWEISGNEVIHHVKAAVLPDWIGTDLVRTYCFNGKQLTLTANYDNDESIALVWEKI